MSNVFSKYLGKMALLAAAVLWAGCNDVNKNSGSEKSASKYSSSSSAVEKLSPVGSSDSGSFLDSAEQHELKHTRDSLMKVFFPVERNDKRCMVKVNAGLRYDIGNLLKHGKAQKYGCARKKRVSVVKKSHFDFVEEKICADGGGIGCALASLYGAMIPNDRNRCKSCYMDKVNPEQIVLDKDAKVDVEHVVKVVRMRSHGLLHLYRKEVKSLERFESLYGQIVLKFTIASNGSIENIQIESSTMDDMDFDEIIKNAVSRWTFAKGNKGTISIPFTFHEK